MISEISDAVIVFYGHLAICTLNQLIKRTKTILHDKQWFLVAVPECVQNIAKSLRIDLPAPVAGFQIRVWHTAQKISLSPDIFFRICCGTDTDIITEGNKVYGVFQDFHILIRHRNADAVFPHITFRISRIAAADMDI